MKYRSIISLACLAAILGIMAIIYASYGRSDGPASAGLSDPARRARAEKVISSFENGTTDIQYDYAKQLGDGRGITVGRSGFTTGTSDALMVVSRYDDAKGNGGSRLGSYLPALRELERQRAATGKMVGSVQGLGGFEDAWQQASRQDPVLNRVQDDVYDQLYFNPAMRIAKDLGIRSAAGQLIVLDSIVMQGNGDDADGVPAMVRETGAKAGNIAQAGEGDWLRAFLDIRRQHLQNAADPATRSTWQQAVGRVDTLRAILDTNPDLDAPLDYEAFGTRYRIDG